ncbi:sorbosone dehydrogenase family protein [Massilia sp. ZL223]|uniref:PQQ-dependent sugar dehydrogenase n=1 Tax=Massilia sp. ZL223 TaxID=2824904 RepID=UPI001B831C18|nr:PQQ-dependent sugar dehydrogenase [Massilia sp. ZL223]MBQ5962034.1 PQQ-dependent sugar dehydrogenase [Massilia sp. ZL223]
MKPSTMFRILMPALAGMVATATAAGAQAPAPLADPIPGQLAQSHARVALETVVSGLVSPVAAAVAPGDRRHLYVADQIGLVWRVHIANRAEDGDDDDDDDDVGSRQPEQFLDVRSLLVSPLGLGPGKYDERGLLGIAFHPQFRFNGLFYTFTSQPVKGAADFSTMPAGAAPNCQSVVTEWRVQRPGRRNSPVDLGSARELMRIDKPQFNHNGGAIAFGPDQMLYISLGDGGAGDDEGVGHVPGGNAQSLAPGNVLGKILRIDPLGRNAANGRYGIPADNPFVNRDGADEIFAYGFRNPFRMSFDPMGRLIVGDVGQNQVEEVDVVTAGGNYGWRIKEGTFLFDTGGPDAPGFVHADSPGLPAGLIDPIAQYDHADGAGAPPSRVAVIGGYVYRGNRIQQLKGQYVFGDYSGRGGPTPQGHLFVLGRNNRVENLTPVNRNPFDLAMLGFAQDQRGELYLLANGTGTLLGTTGVVMKFVRARR